ncbi:MAG: bifunctional ornithine acetyltransferase/N-acetylglutamate synthase, partial [Candidatus Abyssubacteria bacterium]|nr:bifunctional ornithine acetyltransferase/N-acetylglutamate synthase [Candidatus Abyssubacteria bacterium]
MIVRDGEGATKLIRIEVVGAITREDAHKTAKTIANSPLVKTAMFGNDANWGRIIMAVGSAGVEINPEIIDIFLCDIPMLKSGRPRQFDEEQAAEALAEKEVNVKVDLHMGNESATVLTCDLSCDYVKINASYRT